MFYYSVNMGTNDFPLQSRVQVHIGTVYIRKLTSSKICFTYKSRKLQALYNELLLGIPIVDNLLKNNSKVLLRPLGQT